MKRIVLLLGFSLGLWVESKVTRKRTAELLSQAIAEGLTPEEED